MKKILAFAFACLLAVSAQAQIVSSHSRSVTRQSNNADYERVYLSYAPISMDPEHGDSESLTGFNFGYLYGKSISSELPLYVEYGSYIQYAWKTEHDVTTSMLNMTVPVNLAYKFAVSDGVAITPYAGLHVRGNILGQMSDDEDTESFFSKDDMGGSDYTANRAQFGYQVGVGLTFNTFYVGASYTQQFTEYMKHMKTSGFMATLGIEF